MAVNFKASPIGGHEVTVDGVMVGRVQRRDTTKTGFKRGRCVGQVPVKRWFAWNAMGSRIGPTWSGLGRTAGFRTRNEAVQALVEVPDGQ